jgi:hypothetical protein
VTLAERIAAAHVVRNIVWVEDPDSGWGHDRRKRDLPRECDCPARWNDELAEGEPDFTCDCPSWIDESLEPTKRAMWEVCIFEHPHGRLFASGFGQSAEEAYDAAVSSACAKYLQLEPNDG